MANAVIEITLPGLTGFTLTLDLYPLGSDTAAASAITLTEATNRKCTYTGTTTAALTGVHLAIAKESTTVRGEGYVLMDDTTGIHVVVGSPNVAHINGNLGNSNVTQFGGANGTFADGRPEVNLTHIRGTASAGDAGYVGTDQAEITNPDAEQDLTGTTVAAVSGAVGSVTGNVGGSVAGAVGSVTGNVAGSVGSVASGGITAASIADGAITSAKFTVSAISGVATGILEKIDQLWRRFFAKATKTTTEIKTFADNGSTVLTTQTISDSGGTETQGPAS